MYKRILLIVGIDGLIKGMGLLIIPLYLFLMPKQEFGEFGYYFSAIGFLVPIIILGLYVTQIKEFSATNDLQKKKVIFSSTMLLVGGFTGLFFLIISLTGLGQFCFESVFGLQKNATYKYYAFVMLIYSGTLNLALYSHIMSLKSGKALAWFNGLRFLFANIAPLGCLFIGLGDFDTSLERLIGIAIGESSFCIGILYWYGRDYCTWKIDKNFLHRAIQTGLVITPGAIACLFGSMSDRYFLGTYHGMNQLAEYNLAMQFISPAQMIITSIQTVWTPHAFSIEGNRNAYDQSLRFMWKTLAVMTGIMCGVCICVLLGKRFHIIPVNYLDVERLVPLLAVSALASALVNLPNLLLVRFDRASSVSFISWGGAILSLTAGIFITKPFGYYGASISAIVIQIFVLLISWHIAKKCLNKCAQENTVNVFSS
ncbi:MAG: oligosaccharide flippase family protein [Legionellales bacterium]|nr:oligosaccharide flippase family protein [Legionellales bacterium]